MPEYSGAPGSYQIIPTGTFDNYIPIPENGTLYVNPNKQSTKSVKPKLICVEENFDPTIDYPFVAHFQYENGNAQDIYIPIGEENILIGVEGGFMALNQPQLFKAGGGTFDVYFDGNKLIWKVTSIERTKRTAVASEASSSSARCTSKKSFSQSDDLEDLLKPSDEITIYPNPAFDKATIVIDGDIENAELFLVDVQGRINSIGITRLNSSTLELDLSAIKPGFYFVRVKANGYIKHAQLIRQ